METTGSVQVERGGMLAANLPLTPGSSDNLVNAFRLQGVVEDVMCVMTGRCILHSGH